LYSLVGVVEEAEVVEVVADLVVVDRVAAGRPAVGKFSRANFSSGQYFPAANNLFSKS
jgi:hypothetical protein